MTRADDPRDDRARGPDRARIQPCRRPSSCSTGAQRRSARGADRRGAEGGTAMSDDDPRVQTAARSPRTTSTARCGRGGWRTSSARRRSRSSSRSRSRPPRAAARRSTTFCWPGRPGLGKTSLAQIVAAELGVPFVQTAGPGARAQGRHRRVPDRARAALGVLRRRDPPPAAGARGDLLSGDGGPLPADHRRPGRRRARRHDRPAAVHADRRDDAHRPADDAAARPLRDPAPARPLRRDGARADRAPLGAAARTSRSRTAGAVAIAAAQPRHAARRQPAAQARARLRRGARRRRRHRPTSPRRRSTCSRSTTQGLDRLDREILRTICEKFGGGPGRALDARRRRSARSRTRSRTSTSRTCCSAG